MGARRLPSQHHFHSAVGDAYLETALGSHATDLHRDLSFVAHEQNFLGSERFAKLGGERVF